MQSIIRYCGFLKREHVYLYFAAQHIRRNSSNTDLLVYSINYFINIENNHEHSFFNKNIKESLNSCISEVQ